ncbi:hypothetical protein [Ancylobacter amanitiformis]|uniref:Uncharacterized protein n=1 Tax=Ancylobacter amanitiformis TaxID=217069 RepID=A0ABU0LRC7_9HYPH|nr:hypothetical protein [Ancylobacter amanitiformis]MDQ0511262.1 hypothetical protein [Ancylobacter amanitiformis]
MKHTLSITLTLFLLGAAPAAMAGPCEQAVKDTQAALDRVIADIAALSPTAPESEGALLSHDPSPEGIAKEEAELGDGVAPEKALEALERARTAAAAGDEDGCQKYVAAARDAIGLQ